MTPKEFFKKALILFIILGGLYVLASLYLLEGKLTYWTSGDAVTIMDSKKENLFVTDKLFIKAEGDSLYNWQDKFEIWTNKRYETKFFGIAFYWTFHDPSWRYLNIKPKTNYIENNWMRSKLLINQEEMDYMNSGGWEPCCNNIKCRQNDTVQIEFIKADQKDNSLGRILVVVQ